MQLKVDMSSNKQEYSDLNLILAEVLEVYLKKLSVDSPEAFQQLVEGGSTGIVTGFTATVGFRVKGQDELQLLTVDPHGSDHLELLTVEAETNEAGELIWGSVKDNENDSKFSDVEVMIAEGLPTDFKEIESKYYSDLLDEKHSAELGEFTVVISESDISAKTEAVVQYFKGDMLIQEISIELTDGTTMEAVIEHYRQLK